MTLTQTLIAGLVGTAVATAALAAEYPIGKPKDMNGLEVAAVYLQPIEMDPPGMMRAAKDSDIHLEADIHATADNKNGLPEGAWAMTLECGVRFLTDYLQGDVYFRTHREGHNLDRCRTQFKLVAEMEKQWEQMAQVITDLT